MRSLLLLCACLSPLAHAGTRAVYEQAADPGRLVFEIADNGDFRAGAPGSLQYRLVLGGESYQVAEVDGKQQVARLADIEEVLRASAHTAGRSLMRGLSALVAATPQRIVRRELTEVNGWQGEVYQIEGAEWEFDRDGAWRDPEGPPYYIVSRDPALRQVGPALASFTKGELAFGRHLLADSASRVLLATLDQVAARGTLNESSQNGLLLVQAGPLEVDPSRLILPAPPLSRAALSALVKDGRNPFRAIVAN
jgi:hypothetical protein